MFSFLILEILSVLSNPFHPELYRKDYHRYHHYCWQDNFDQHLKYHFHDLQVWPHQLCLLVKSCLTLQSCSLINWCVRWWSRTDQGEGPLHCPYQTQDLLYEKKINPIMGGAVGIYSLSPTGRLKKMGLLYLFNILRTKKQIPKPFLGARAPL